MRSNCRNHGNTKNLFELNCVDLHSLFFRHIDHVQCDDHRVAQFDELQREFKAPAKNGGINHVYDQVWFLVE